MNPVQFPLRVQLRDDATFANFYAGPNAAALSAVQSLSAASGGLVYLWGAQGVGRSHLLQAACLECQQRGGTALYLPLGELSGISPSQLKELDEYQLLCLDDLDALVGNAAWEEGIFHLFNRVRDAGRSLLLAATQAPRGLELGLADLKSRLMLALVYQLHPLSDEDRVRALQMRAKQRGLLLSEEVGRFILTRAPRSTDALFALLERLDRASLQAQRKLTIPFLKEVLGW